MRSLYNIRQEHQALIGEIIDSEGEISEELNQKLLINKDEFETKAVSYAMVTKEIEGNVSTIDNEIKRLQGLKSKQKRIVEKLKNAVSEAMIAFEIDKLESELFTFSFRKSKAVIIDDEALIPEQYFKLVQSVDKTSLKKDLELNNVIFGASIEERKNLQIK